jgi:signal transduction histidine kinase
MAMARQSKIDYTYVLVGWGFYGIYMSIQSYLVNERLGRPITWSKAFAGDLSYSAVWVLLTPAVLWLARKFPLEKKNLAKGITIHLVASVAFALLHKAIHNAVLALYMMGMEGSQFSWEVQFRNLIAYFDYGIQLYWIIVLLYASYEYYTRYQEKELRASQLETQLAHAQLQTLKMQLQPHFLFNTLNAISVLIQENPKAAHNMIGQLSDLLRLSLAHVETQEVPLRRELEFLDRYLEIQQMRFGDRLTVNKHIGDATLDAQVPYLILQPLVENALHYGISSQPGPGILEITAVRENGILWLGVRDTGPGMGNGEENAHGPGVGLSNTQARLRQLYGERQSLTFTNAVGGGLQVMVSIPFRVVQIEGKA